MKIVLDAMGSDHAPASEIEGALIATEKYGVEIILVGQENLIKPKLAELGGESNPRISIVHCDEVIGMNDSPAMALKQKKNSSICVGVELVSQKMAEGFISAGNTGAVMAASLFKIGRLQGISRPALAATIPTIQDPCVLLDVGANVDCRPQHLVHFAIMGKVYYENVLGKQNPTIGLLSIGEEKEKGNDLTSKTHELLAGLPLNFIGNVEGRDIPKGGVDVVVCDGFVGNVILKFGEGLAKMILRSLMAEMGPVLANGNDYSAIQSVFERFQKKVDYSEYGGVQLLGINGTSIVCHGRSNAKAIANAIRSCMEYLNHDVNQRIAAEIKPVEE